MRTWLAFLTVSLPTCTSRPEPARVGEIDLRFEGTAADALHLVGRLVDRRLVLDDPDGLSRLRVSWSTEERQTPADYTEALLWAMARAGIPIDDHDGLRVGPVPEELETLSLVTVDLPVDGLDTLSTVDFEAVWVQAVRPDRILVACACAFPIVPVTVTDVAVAREPPEAPLLVDIIESSPRLAVIREPGSIRARVVETGDLLDDLRRIERITSKAVVLDDEHRIARFDLPDAWPANVPPEGAVRVTTGGYQVRLSALEPYFAAPARLGAALPHRGSDGAIDGVELSKLWYKSWPVELGLHNHDIVHRVGDVSVRGASDLDAVVRELRTKNELCVQLTRRKEPIRLCYARSG